jgi:hypothetical protein
MQAAIRYRAQRSAQNKNCVLRCFVYYGSHCEISAAHGSQGLLRQRLLYGNIESPYAVLRWYLTSVMVVAVFARVLLLLVVISTLWISRTTAQEEPLSIQDFLPSPRLAVVSKYLLAKNLLAC